MTRFIAGWLITLSMAAGLSACAPAAWSPPPVPPPQAEERPLPYISATEQVWRPGHWDWDGRGYRWIPGEYQPRTASQGNLWRMGSWQRDAAGAWVWLTPGWM